jgi:hypothetical protein
MYSIRKNGFGDSTQDDSLSLRCEHGELLQSCIMESCIEMWRLYQQAINEKQREYDEWVYAQNAKRKRGKSKSEFEIAIEQPGVSNKREDYELKLPEETLETTPAPEVPRKMFRTLFADEMTFRAALQFRVLKLSEACLVKAYLASNDKLPDSKRWAAIGKRLGISGKTVERRFRRLVGKLLKSRLLGSENNGTVKAVHVRGERKLRYYRIRSIKIGEWKRDWTELITDKKVIRELRRKTAPMIRLKKTPIPSSPVNRLFGALIRHFASDLPAGDVRPYDITVHDWEYNLRWAERLLKRKSAGPWTALEVHRILTRGAGLCDTCHTLLIRGFKINGSRITRAKEFCDKACQMRAERRKD